MAFLYCALVAQVAAEAKGICTAPSNGDLEVKITFFYKAVPDFDTDTSLISTLS